jgi:hypothetical protein
MLSIKKSDKNSFCRQLLINNRLKKLNTATLKFNLKLSATYNLFFEDGLVFPKNYEI